MNLPTDSFWQEWRDAGLPAPPLPSLFVPALHLIAPLTYSTRSVLPYSLYALEAYLAEADRKPAPYLAIGHAGQGMNSWAIHYYLVSNTLQLFVQSRYGGIYTNEEQALAALTTRFEQIDTLINEVVDSPHLRESGDILRVVESDRGSRFWGLTTTFPQSSATPLRDAIAWLSD